MYRCFAICSNMFGNSNFGNHVQLYSMTGFNLTIRPDGSILGTQDDEDCDSYLEITNAGHVAYVHIKGLSTGLYVCFNENGVLYGEDDCSHSGTIFKENLDGDYNVYRSIQYPDWYIGIKKSGIHKHGPRTCADQKAVRFLPRRSNVIE